MKVNKIIWLLIFQVVTITCAPISQVQAGNPIVVIIKKIIKKIIKAIDLMVQRLQNKKVELQNAQKILENKLSKLKLDQIAEWTEKHRKLFEKYYHELWEVKKAIASFKQIEKIIRHQKDLVNEYQQAWAIINDHPSLSIAEINYLEHAYANLIAQSANDLERLGQVVLAMEGQFTDSRRLEIISEVAKSLESHAEALRKLNFNVYQVIRARTISKHEILGLKNLYP